MSFTLYEHQIEILNRLTENDRYLLLAEVGTGKTLPSLIHLSNLIMGGEVKDALIVAPLSGLGAWKRDIEKLAEDRRQLVERHTRFINYDKLSRKDGRYQRECMRPWDFILLDEGHAISNPTSNRTKYFVGRGKMLGLAAGARYRYLLTGTLIANSRLEDLWAPLRYILDDEWPTWSDFKRRYLVTKYLPGSYAEIVVGYRNRKELLDLVGRYSYRVLKKDCLDLPEVLEDEVITVPFATGRNPAPFAKSTAQLYEDAMESYVEALDMVMDNPLTRLLRMRQIAAGHIKESDTLTEDGVTVRGATHRLSCDKTRYAVELIANNLPKKTVVFYQFTDSCDALTEALTKAKIQHLTLNGAQKDKDIWRRFQDDEDIKVIVVQYQAGSTAIDLFASSYTIYLEPTNSSNIMEQSRARTHRNGQEEACGYVFLLTKDSVEEDMYAALQKHEDFSEEAYREIARARLASKRHSKPPTKDAGSVIMRRGRDIHATSCQREDVS